MKSICIFSDVHAPYHDPEAVELLCQVLADRRPDIVISNGDFPDFYALSSFRKDPRRKALLEDELQTAIPVYEDIRLCAGDARKVWIGGNHDWRLERYLMQNAPALVGMAPLTVAELFGLEEDGWEIVEYRDSIDIGKVVYTHDLSGTGPYCVQHALRDAGHSIVIGHTHRISTAVVGNIRGKSRVGCSFGWLGDASQVDYMHKLKVKRDWALGFGWGWMEDDGTTWFQAVPIINGKCVVEGKVYSG